MDDLRKEYEQSAFSSITDLGEDFTTYARTDPGGDVGFEPFNISGSMGRAISRAFLANSKPWLVGELYNSKNHDPRPIENWVANMKSTSTISSWISRSLSVELLQEQR